MKVTIEKCLNALGAIEATQERVTQNGQLLNGVTIPAGRAATGYWIGRLEDKLTPIRKRFIKTKEELIKQYGEAVIDKNEKGEDVTVEGKFRVKPMNGILFQNALEDLMQQEEDVEISPLNFELFDGIQFPLEFLKALIPFINEPKA